MVRLCGILFVALTSFLISSAVGYNYNVMPEPYPTGYYPTIDRLNARAVYRHPAEQRVAVGNSPYSLFGDKSATDVAAERTEQAPRSRAFEVSADRRDSVLSHVGDELENRIEMFQTLARSFNKLLSDVETGAKAVFGKGEEGKLRSLFDTSATTILLDISDDFKQVAVNFFGVFLKLKQDIVNTFHWLSNFPGFVMFSFVVNMMRSFFDVLWLFPRSILRFVIPAAQTVTDMPRMLLNNDY